MRSLESLLRMTISWALLPGSDDPLPTMDLAQRSLFPSVKVAWMPMIRWAMGRHPRSKQGWPKLSAASTFPTHPPSFLPVTSLCLWRGVSGGRMGGSGIPILLGSEREMRLTLCLRKKRGSNGPQGTPLKASGRCRLELSWHGVQCPCFTLRMGGRRRER